MTMKVPSDPSEPNAQGWKALDEHSVDVIGSKLRGLYDGYLSEPLPESILDLMAKLDDVPAQRSEDEDGR